MPTYSQTQGFINELRNATPANPISHTELADALGAILDYFSNTGSWDPVAAMNVANSKANKASESFTGNTTFENIMAPVVGASAASAAKGVNFKNLEYLIGYGGDNAGANLIGALFSHLDSASYAFRFGKHTGASGVMANGSNFVTQLLIANSGVAHFASRLHINTGADFTDQGIPAYINGAARIVGALTTNRLAGAGNTPTIAAGTGAGTSPTVSIVGTDTAGRITITTGTSPAANATIATITFAGGAYGSAPYVSLTPSNQPAAALSGANMPFPSSTTTTFVLTSGTTALTAATTYTFNYLIVQ